MKDEKNTKMICWDMDGTIASLYGVDNWLSKLRAEDTSPYEDAAPMWDMELLNYVCELLRAVNIKVSICSSLSRLLHQKGELLPLDNLVYFGIEFGEVI